MSSVLVAAHCLACRWVAITCRIGGTRRNPASTLQVTRLGGASEDGNVMTDRIDAARLIRVGEVDERYQSYNVEMAEVTGGTFWKPYTDAQRAGLEPVNAGVNPLAAHAGDGATGFADNHATMAPLPPVDLSGVRIRTLAAALGPVYLRVSGSWASHTYFDVDGTAGGTAPAGYNAVLTREQWDGLIDFARAVGGELVTSMANTDGAHDDTGAWDPTQHPVRRPRQRRWW